MAQYSNLIALTCALLCVLIAFVCNAYLDTKLEHLMDLCSEIDNAAIAMDFFQTFGNVCNLLSVCCCVAVLLSFAQIVESSGSCSHPVYYY